MSDDRAIRRRAAETRGRTAEARAAAALSAEGWRILGSRVRTAEGELDLIAEHHGVLAFIEVKARETAAAAAASLSLRQQRRIATAAALWLAENPGQGTAGIRFDVLVLGADGTLRRIADAFRLGDAGLID